MTASCAARRHPPSQPSPVCRVRRRGLLAAEGWLHGYASLLCLTFKNACHAEASRLSSKPPKERAPGRRSSPHWSDRPSAFVWVLAHRPVGDLGPRRVGGLSLGLAPLVRWAPPSQTCLERKVRPRGPSLCAAHRHRGRSLSCFSDLNAREREHTPLGQNVGHIGQYGVKMSFWGAETLKIVVLVENHPKKRIFCLADYHPPSVVGGVNQRTL